MLQVCDWLSDEGQHDSLVVLPHALLTLELSRSHHLASNDMKPVEKERIDNLLYWCKTWADMQERCEEPMSVYMKVLQKFDPRCFDGECPFHLVESIVRDLGELNEKPLSPEEGDDVINTTSMFILDSKNPLAKLTKKKDGTSVFVYKNRYSNYKFLNMTKLI
jgi:hypothetical protein